MKKKEILMIVNTPIQYDARVQRAASALKEYGVTVLSLNGDRNYRHPNFESRIYTNHWCKGFMLNLVYWMYLLSFCLRNRDKYGLFYIHDYPIVFAGRLAACLCRKKWIYDAHELLLERKTSKRSVKRQFFVFLERISIRHADLVVAANYERARIVRQIYKLKNAIYINNIASVPGGKKQKVTKKEYIVYQGYVAKERDLRPFIRALIKVDKHIQLKIIGGGDGVDYYNQYVRRLNLSSRVVFTGRLPYDSLLKESEEGKVGILVYPMEGLNNIYCAPNKIYEYAEAGLPVLVSPQPFLKYIVQKYHIGECLEYPFEEEDIARKVNALFKHYDSYCREIKRFLDDYSFEKEQKKLEKVVSDLFEC